MTPRSSALVLAAAVLVLAAAAGWIFGVGVPAARPPAAAPMAAAPPAGISVTVWTGKVVAITDGDTVKVLRDGRPVAVRLAGIDAPERAQPWGDRARQFTGDLAAGQVVRVVDRGPDRYGRTLGEVVLPDGRSLNRELIAAGLAWVYRSTPSTRFDTDFAAIEQAARAARRGLWSDPEPIPPWDWRKRPRSSDPSDPPDRSDSSPRSHL